MVGSSAGEPLGFLPTLARGSPTSSARRQRYLKFKFTRVSCIFSGNSRGLLFPSYR